MRAARAEGDPPPALGHVEEVLVGADGLEVLVPALHIDGAARGAGVEGVDARGVPHVSLGLR